MEKPNIVIAPDFSCGGIIVALLNKTPVVWNNERLPGSVSTIEHEHLKYYTENRVKSCKPGVWYHTHSEDIPLHHFSKRIVITTESLESRFIIFLRAQKFLNPNWVYDETLDSIDPIRELAKQYALNVIVSPNTKCHNIELADALKRNCRRPLWKEWLVNNQYIFQDNIWMKKRFDEAVWEIKNKQPYQYY